MLIKVPELSENQSLYCPGCHSHQFTLYKNALVHCVAYSLCALILFALANSFPFLTFEAQGQSRVITVAQAANDLIEQEFFFLASLVYAFVLILPLLYLVCLLSLTMSLLAGIKVHSPILIGRTISFFYPWIMAEVFIVGVLVALIKVISMADIVFGFAFWAYIGFVVFLLLTANIASRHQLWQWVDDARH